MGGVCVCVCVSFGIYCFVPSVCFKCGVVVVRTLFEKEGMAFFAWIDFDFQFGSDEEASMVYFLFCFVYPYFCYHFRC
jgi:hypothetical protein